MPSPPATPAREIRPLPAPRSPAPPRTTNPRLPRITRPLLAFFHRIVRGNLRRSFHAVRVHNLALLQQQTTGPLVVYMNHSSWWDPMTAYLLSQQLPRRRHFAPMDAAALARYPILRRLGVFPIDLDSARGGVQFLRTAQAILAAGGVLWVTPQGRFADVRDRPPALKSGLAALAARFPSTTFLPLAIEYLFWDERTPELLVSVGQPQRFRSAHPETIEAQLTAALDAAMADLASRARSRSESAFTHILLRGRVGVGGFYGLGQQLRALILRRPFQPEHRATVAVPQAKP